MDMVLFPWVLKRCILVEPSVVTKIIMKEWPKFGYYQLVQKVLSNQNCQITIADIKLVYFSLLLTIVHNKLFFHLLTCDQMECMQRQKPWIQIFEDFQISSILVDILRYYNFWLQLNETNFLSIQEVTEIALRPVLVFWKLNRNKNKISEYEKRKWKTTPTEPNQT